MALAIDPTNANIIFAGTDGGVFKTTNGGASWSLSLAVTIVRAVVIDPTSPGTVYAAGVQSVGNQGHFNGVFKTTNAGASWTAIPVTPILDEERVYALALDPANPGTVYAGTYGSCVYKTVNGGSSWTPVPYFAAYVLALAVDPTNTATVYAATYGGVYKTTNGGTNWAPMNNGMTVPPSGQVDVHALAIDPAQTSTVYVANSNGYYGGAVYKSTDGAANWSVAAAGLPAITYASSIVINPANTNVVYVSGSVRDYPNAGPAKTIFRTTDGGTNWAPVATDPFGALTDRYDIATTHALAMAPGSPNTLYAGTLALGVFKTTSGGTTWNAVNDGIAASFVQYLTVDPSDVHALYAVTHGRVLKSIDAGVSWETIHSGLPMDIGDVLKIAVDPTNSNTLYAGSTTVHKSLNRGASWTESGTGLPAGVGYIAAVVVDPTAPSTVYAATAAGIYKSTNAGATWSWSNAGLGAQSWMLRMHPTDSNILYVGNASGVFKTTNGGASWNPTGFSSYVLYASLEIDPLNPETLYVGAGNGVWKTTNGGLTWNQSNSGLPLNSAGSVLAIDPVNPNALYVQTWAGIYRTTDGAASWSAFNLELPLDVRAANLTVQPGTARVYAGSYTNGLFAFHEGASGVVRGVVRNGNTLAPIAGAGVSIDGVHQGVTNGGGEYSYVTTAGVHAVSATALGFSTGSAPTVTVNTWATTSVPDVLLFPRGSTFTNSTLITIEGGFDPATTPYPSIINVSGVRGSITGLAVRVIALGTASLGALDMVLVGPGGQAFAFMSDADAGAGTTAAPVTYTFADFGVSTALGASGIYKPINWNSGTDNFPAPGPGTSFSSPAPTGSATFASVFGGTSPNGAWKLFAVSDSSVGGGSIAGGWSLVIVTNAPSVDLEGDGRTDFAITRNTGGALVWHTLNSAAYAPIQWGTSTDVAVPADYDGDGKTDIAVWRPSTGTFWVRKSSDGGLLSRRWGQEGDDPGVVGDYDGDGKDDFAVYRPGNPSVWWVLRSSNDTFYSVGFGQAGDKPLPGDYDGDGRSDFAVARGPGAATVYLQQSTAGFFAAPWGLISDSYQPGDYDGDGKTDMAVARQIGGSWYHYVRQSSNGSLYGQVWGLSADLLAPGDYDGDGKTDFAIWRGAPASSAFYALRSSNHALLVQPWGLGGDTPVASFVVR